MSANLVADSLMERMTSLSDLGLNLTENVKHYLEAIKEKCSGPEKLNLTDPKTREWVGKVIDLFYVVDDLYARVAQSNVIFGRKCNLTSLLQLKRIEKKLLRLVESMENLKVFPKHDVKKEEAETTERRNVKKIIMANALNREEGFVRAVVTYGASVMQKKKFAKYVCEDEEVKSGFDNVVLCFDSKKLQGDYADSIVDKLKEKNNEGKGKGFLLVLDCFQNEDEKEWLKLAEKVKEFATTSRGGGVLLVAAASLAVAKLVGFSFQPTQFLLDWLSPFAPVPQPAFELIVEAIESLQRIRIEEEVPAGSSQHTRGEEGPPGSSQHTRREEGPAGSSQHTPREEDEMEARGLLKTLAELVRCRKPNPESDMKEMKEEFLQEILLKHYSDLNLLNWSQRQCYAYTLLISISEHPVKRENLIRLWMAEGFLGHSSPSREPEDLGHEYIDEFSRRSIFLDMGEAGICIDEKYPSMRAFALGRHDIYMKDKSVIDKEVRRLLLSSELDVSNGIPKSVFDTNKNVRTFLLKKEKRSPNQVMLSWSAADAIFSAFKRLRVLKLKNLGMTVLPDSIRNCKSLRYLDLSHNNFEELPICVGEFRHLQTLLLSYCFNLRKLPNGVNHFPSLSSLEVDQCSNLMHMPPSLKKLTQIRSLPHFVASDQNGIRELLHLNEIRGVLEISHLERLKLKHLKYGHYYLKEKKHLKGLILRWNRDEEDGEEKRHSFEDNHDKIILKHHLQPHPDLKRLSVIGYGGNDFDYRFSPLKNLVEISLYNCPKIQWLSTLDHHLFVNLEKLTLTNLNGLQFITDNDSKDLKLKQLKILDCPNLTSWWESGAHNTEFTDISELVIRSCPKLLSMPLFPNIDDELILDCSNMEPLLNTLRLNSSSPLSKLKRLTIVNIDEKQYPRQQEWLKNFTYLETFEIVDCKDLKSIKGWKALKELETLRISNCTGINLPVDEWKGLKQLTSLIIENISDMKSLPEGIKHLTMLASLEIKNCATLSSVPNDSVEDIFWLRFVTIVDCPNLVSLPKSFSDVIRLEIANCPKLASLPRSFANIISLTVTDCPLLDAYMRSGKKQSSTQNTNSEPFSFNLPPMRWIH